MSAMAYVQDVRRCKAHRLLTRTDTGKVRVGSVVLVFDCNRFGHKYRCKSRPNVVVEVGVETATLLPVSSTATSSVTLQSGEAGLKVASYLQPKPYTIELHKVGPVVGMIDPRKLFLELTALLPPGERRVWFRKILRGDRYMAFPDHHAEPPILPDSER